MALTTQAVKKIKDLQKDLAAEKIRSEQLEKTQARVRDLEEEKKRAAKEAKEKEEEMRKTLEKRELELKKLTHDLAEKAAIEQELRNTLAEKAANRHELAEQAQMQACPRCEETCHEGENFCEYCGEALTTQAQQQPDTTKIFLGKTITIQPGALGINSITRESNKQYIGKVTEVLRGAPAEQYGVKVGWRIIAVQGEPCEGARDPKFIQAKESGNAYQVTFSGAQEATDIFVIGETVEVKKSAADSKWMTGKILRLNDTGTVGVNCTSDVHNIIPESSTLRKLEEIRRIEDKLKELEIPEVKSQEDKSKEALNEYEIKRSEFEGFLKEAIARLENRCKGNTKVVVEDDAVVVKAKQKLRQLEAFAKVEAAIVESDQQANYKTAIASIKQARNDASIGRNTGVRMADMLYFWAEARINALEVLFQVEAKLTDPDTTWEDLEKLKKERLNDLSEYERLNDLSEYLPTVKKVNDKMKELESPKTPLSSSLSQEKVGQHDLQTPPKTLLTNPGTDNMGTRGKTEKGTPK